MDKNIVDEYVIKKVTNAVALAKNLGIRYLEKNKFLKLLFFADKEHLKIYGRPIFFYKYVKTKKGPVPEKFMVALDRKRDFNERIFSESELEILKEVFSRFKNSKDEELFRILSELPEYKKTSLYECIPYSEMAENMKEYVSFWEKEKDAFIENLRAKTPYL